MTTTKAGKICFVRILLCCCGLAVLILTAPVESYAFDTAVIDWAIQQLCGHITGKFGALLTAVAILGAIVAAIMGSYRTFFGAIIVGVGAFATPDIVKVQFKSAGAQCSSGAGTKSAVVMTTNLKGSLVAAEEENSAAPISSTERVTASRNGPGEPPAAKTAKPAEEEDENLEARTWDKLTSDEES